MKNIHYLLCIAARNKSFSIFKLNMFSQIQFIVTAGNCTHAWLASRSLYEFALRTHNCVYRHGTQKKKERQPYKSANAWYPKMHGKSLNGAL